MTVNEAPRLKDEELAGLDAELLVLPWTQDRNEALPTGAAIGSDGTVPGTRDASELIEQARRALAPAEIDRYRLLGQDAAAAVTQACTALLPTHTEDDPAAATAAALLKRSTDPIVPLVAGESRPPHHQFSEMFTSELSETTRVIYGGSVTATNITDIMAGDDTDGALVGGASLDPRSFAAICHAGLTQPVGRCLTGRPAIRAMLVTGAGRSPVWWLRHRVRWASRP